MTRQPLAPITTAPRVLVAGATGLVGRALVARLSSMGSGARTTALLRQAHQRQALPSGIDHQVVDFQRLGQAGVPGLPDADWAFCCLGTTIAQAGSQAAFRAVDFDAVLAFARAALAAGATRFGLVSALGADARSSVFYNRVKGEAEQALAALGWPQLVIARPSLLLGDRQSLGQRGRPMEQLAQRLMPGLGWLVPPSLRPICADAVAAALLAAVVRDAPGTTRLASGALQALASTAASSRPR